MKRKLASLRGFYSWVQSEGIISISPFSHLPVRIQAPRRLPKIIPRDDLTKLFRYIYSIGTPIQTKDAFLLVRNRAIIELLLATGIRVAELCSLNTTNLDMGSDLLSIIGKGDKERTVQIENPDTIEAISVI